MSIEIVHCALTLDGLKSSYGVTFLWTEMLKCYERATRYSGLHKENRGFWGWAPDCLMLSIKRGFELLGTFGRLSFEKF